MTENAPGDSEHDSIDRALSRLRERTAVEDRLQILRQLTQYWHGPIVPADGIPEAELEPLQLPSPLRWWYCWAGRREEIMRRQNILLAPHELTIEDDRLLFYLENQAVYRWATLPEGDDPPVFGRYETSRPWQAEGITLSEHLILACLFEAVLCHAPYRASLASISSRRLRALEQVIPPIAASWRWNLARFHVAKGAFMCSMSAGENDNSLWSGAKTAAPLRLIERYLEAGWDWRLSRAE